MHMIYNTIFRGMKDIICLSFHIYKKILNAEIIFIRGFKFADISRAENRYDSLRAGLQNKFCN